MIQYQGIAKNIEKSVLGKITKNKLGYLNRKDRILVIEKIPKRVWGYKGVVTTKTNGKINTYTKVPLVSGIDFQDLNNLKDGDIVLLEPNGIVNILWDINSSHNSILATEECNCMCIMCPQPHHKDNEGLFEFNMKLLSLLEPNKINHIGITGGEPTLIGDNLFSLIKLCRDRFPNASLTLLTNGINFKDIEYARKLAAINHPDLQICVSLYADTDSVNDLILGKKGSFYETIKGLQNLALFRQKIEIRTVVHALNYKRLLHFADIIYHNFPFVVHVAFMGMEVIGLASKNLKRVWIDPKEYISQLKEAVVYLDRRAINVSIYNLQLCILPEELWKFSKQSISTWKKTFINQCLACDFQDECGGFFATSKGQHSNFIKPLKRY